MTIAVTLDWLAFTFTEMTNDAKQFILRDLLFESGSSEQPRNGYDTSIRTKDNVVLSWCTAREDMGTHVVFAGSALRNFCERTSETQHSLICGVLQRNARISRLDIAKDAQDVRINLSTIWQEIHQGKRQGNARTFAKMESGAEAITIYVGSRQSERFARIYDKAKEQGNNIAEWKRYELECKGMVSRALASILSTEPKWGAAFDAVALAMLDLPDSADYQAFFPAGEAEVSFPKIEKTTDRETWIEKQCVPAIVKHYIEHPDSKAVTILIEALELARRAHNGFD